MQHFSKVQRKKNPHFSRDLFYVRDRRFRSKVAMKVGSAALTIGLVVFVSDHTGDKR